MAGGKETGGSVNASAALLLVALCGGYWFNSIWLRTKYYSAREAGHRLYFRAAGHAVWLVFLISACLFPVALHLAPPPQLVAQPPLADLFDIYMQLMRGRMGILSVLLSLPVAVLLGILFNLYYRLPGTRVRLLKKVVDGRELEKLVLYAAETKLLLQITLDTGKVYVGWVLTTIDPTKEREYLRVMPLMSGYRTSDTHGVEFTVIYTDVVRLRRKTETPRAGLNGFEVNPELSGLKPVDFEIVLPSARIVSAHRHDARVYRKLSGKQSAPTSLATG